MLQMTDREWDEEVCKGKSEGVVDTVQPGRVDGCANLK